jgi:hypothetical protein
MGEAPDRIGSDRMKKSTLDNMKSSKILISILIMNEVHSRIIVKAEGYE